MVWSLPRGIPAASLKLGQMGATAGGMGASSAGNTRGLIEAEDVYRIAADINRSSAGNTRGLIEAIRRAGWSNALRFCLPRGIPAASLKRLMQATFYAALASSAGNTRGLIEARADARRPGTDRCSSSAGNTRGLIEASYASAGMPGTPTSLPRGIPAASLKRWANRPLRPAEERGSSAGNTRGLIEARRRKSRNRDAPRVFRGEYPRPH